MKKLILNPKNKKGIIAELVGENGIRIEKRRSDNFPVKVFISGDNYRVVASCTLTGDPILIECIDGKIQLEDLLIEERQDDGKEKDNKQDPNNTNKNDGTGTGAGADGGSKDGNPGDGGEAGAGTGDGSGDAA